MMKLLRRMFAVKISSNDARAYANAEYKKDANWAYARIMNNQSLKDDEWYNQLYTTLQK